MLLLVTPGATGCQYGAYFFRPTHEPMLALEVRMDPEVRRSCLIVMMPGMLNVPDTYVERGLIPDIVATSQRCDLVSVDAHFGYYRHGNVAERVGEDILGVAERRGYEEVWLLGSSMGAMGAMRVARAHAERIDGIVLFGPWFGDESVIRAIAEAGGLAEWHGPDEAPRDDVSPEALWAWMRGYATSPEDMPPLYIAVGESDGMRPGAELLRPHLPPGHFGLAEGGHEWATWQVLWRRLLVTPPWDAAGRTAGFDVAAAQ